MKVQQRTSSDAEAFHARRTRTAVVSRLRRSAHSECCWAMSAAVRIRLNTRAARLPFAIREAIAQRHRLRWQARRSRCMRRVRMPASATACAETIAQRRAVTARTSPAMAERLSRAMRHRKASS
eukprot:126355-Chlamydomonas_euryale.AAC.5